MDDAVAEAALAGLRASPKTLPPKLFYDPEGCALFDEITRLPEYYPTRTELALLDAVAPTLTILLPEGAALIEYGASSLTKARPVLRAMRRPARYVPIDVAAPALEAVAAEASRAFPDLRVTPVVADFTAGVSFPAVEAGTPKVGFFPGSTIGNFSPSEAEVFLRRARDALGDRALFLIGVDRRKSPAILLPAYDDAAGVTAAFNLNVLRRLNREAGAQFDLAAFRHEARWNDALSRVEMHLASLRRQTVRVAGQDFHFEAGETIHTESSYKPTDAAFLAVAQAARWQSRQLWHDPDALFAIHLLEARDGESGGPKRA